MKPTHQLRGYRQGMVMVTEYAYNWLEADTKVEELLKTSMYDEVRIIKLDKDTKDDVYV